VEVRHINRSSSATRHPKVDTGAKSEYESAAAQGVALGAYILCTSLPPTDHRRATHGVDNRRLAPASGWTRLPVPPRAAVRSESSKTEATENAAASITPRRRSTVFQNAPCLSIVSRRDGVKSAKQSQSK
jgi:hypothetical protein